MSEHPCLTGDDLKSGDRVRVNKRSTDSTRVGLAGTIVWVQGNSRHAGVWVELDRSDIGGRFFAAEELEHE